MTLEPMHIGRAVWRGATTRALCIRMDTDRKGYCALRVTMSPHEWTWTQDEQVEMARELLRLDDLYVRLLGKVARRDEDIESLRAQLVQAEGVVQRYTNAHAALAAENERLRGFCEAAKDVENKLAAARMAAYAVGKARGGDVNPVALLDDALADTEG